MISVIVPVYNEAESLNELYRRITKVLQKRQYEIIFINDGSFDRSKEIITNFKKNDNRVILINFTVNQGKASALKAGFDKATGEIIVTLDADLQDHPEEITMLVDKLGSGYDLVSGWKKKRHDPWYNVILSRCFNFSVRLVTGIKLHDIVSGLKVYRREAIIDLDLYGELHRYIPVILYCQGYRVTELPVAHSARKYGHSKYGPDKFFKGFFDLFTVLFLIKFKNRPLHLFGPIGVFLFGFGLIICLYLSTLWFMGQPIGRRPLLILGILLLIMGIQIFTTGLVAELIVSQKNEKIS